nr:MAG TPA_asm: hypothetical protein [Caudoviricetes sp.]
MAILNLILINSSIIKLNNYIIQKKPLGNGLFY